jgi:SAM-dependent methyltransferase
MAEIEVITNYPIASDSPDHISPWGTARDNSLNIRFNNKLIRLYDYLNRFPKVLDLGCSGGGFVKSCINQGCIAVGLEGSNYSKEHNRAEWPILADNALFTADITKEFQIIQNKVPLQFDVITLWEVMEHLPKDRLDTVCNNIHEHLEDHGLVIASISSNEEVINGIKLHLTIQDKKQWIDMFEKNRLYHISKYSSYFNTQYVRGPKQNAPGSFHLFLSKDPLKVPKIPKLSPKEWLIDRWVMSKMQKNLQKLIVGESIT